MEMPDRRQMVRSRFCGLFWVSRVTGLKVNLIELPRPGISLNHAYIRLAQAVGDLAAGYLKNLRSSVLTSSAWVQHRPCEAPWKRTHSLPVSFGSGG